MQKVYKVKYRCSDGYRFKLITGSIEGAHEHIKRVQGMLNRIISLSIVEKQYLPVIDGEYQGQLYISHNIVESYSELDFIERRIPWLN